MLDINKFFDEGSFIELSNKVSENVTVGYATVEERLVYLISDNGRFLDLKAVNKIEKIYELALETGAPVVYFINNNGIDIKGEYPLSLYGKIYKMQSLARNKIIQIAVVSGNCFSGSSIIAENCDFVFVDKENAKMWTILPISINGNVDDIKSKGENIGKTFFVDGVFDANEIAQSIRDIVYYLPSNCEDNDTYVECTDDLNRKIPIIDFKNDDLVREIADYKKDFEIKKEYAKGTYTGFIKLNGQTIGVIANKNEEKTICKNQLRKINKFMNFLDKFNLPLLSIVDAKAFKIKENEDQDISINIANVVKTYVKLKVPKVVLIKNAIGLPGFIMGSKSMGADLVFAYKDSNIRFMDAKNLALMTFEDEINKSSDKVKALDEKMEDIRKDYNVDRALKEYVIDDVIEKERTRQILVSAFEVLWTKKV